MQFKTLAYALLLLLSTAACTSLYKAKLQEFEKNKQYRFAFYNVENLFDTLDDPLTRDEEFTPTGKKKWSEERYQTKLDQIAQVLGDMNYPAVVGFCEVENAKVLQDLVQKTKLKDYNYKYVHYDSPDKRGIDNGLIYIDGLFKVTNSDATRIDFPKEVVEGYTTRDILHVEGVFRQKDTMHFFVNHWPSRRGGLKASQPKRVYVATQLRKQTNKILTNNPNAKIVITGDFNDEPDNDSVLSALDAKPVGETVENNKLYNCSSKADKEGLGSYRYKGNWNMLDQFIVSGSMINKNSSITLTDAQIFRPAYLVYVDKKYGDKPSRTYGGPKYYGGYSDHFPVFVDVLVK
ncbi:MAG: putative extracellular nuclease [Polaribacter sp.]|jgi:predicted extracellular nuclease